jgi:hypothetical protein
MSIRRIFITLKVHLMIYKKHILTKSDLTLHIHLTYIQLA